MAFDVARVRGLHPTLGDGWVHLDPQAGMLIPDVVATTVSSDFFSRPSSCARLGSFQTLGFSSAALTSFRRSALQS